MVKSKIMVDINLGLIIAIDKAALARSLANCLKHHAAPISINNCP